MSILYMYMCPSRPSDLIMVSRVTLNHHAIKPRLIEQEKESSCMTFRRNTGIKHRQDEEEEEEEEKGRTIER